MEQYAKNHIVVATAPIKLLQSAEYNPRKHSDKQLRDLMESVRKFGMVDPVIANSAEGRKNVVIGGHFRLEAAKKLWMVEVPVVYLSIPDVEKEKELNLRLNKNTGGWDFEMLKEFDVGFLVDLGFGNAELSDVWDSMLGIEDDGFDEKKALEEIGEPKAKRGEIYALGNHRIMCGDSTDPESVKRLAESAGASGKIGMLYFDPPYDIGLDYRRGMGKTRDYGARNTDDGKGAEGYFEFLRKTVSNGLSAASPDAHAFCWCDPNHVGTVQAVLSELGCVPRRVCLWIKNNMNVTPWVAFNRGYEPCVYAVRGKPYVSKEPKNLHEILDKEVGAGNRTAEDVMDLFDVWLARRLPTQEYEHPTAKPPTLHEKPLKRCTAAGDFVLDLFWGSGSTLVACEQLRRRALLMEHEPAFIDVTINRYEKLTGRKAERVG